jgi:hypothetical protein
MGFETTTNKPKVYMSLGATKSNDNKVISKFFVISKRNNQGQYEKVPMIDSNNYPKPFFGYLTKITSALDNVITKSDGGKIPQPKINFEFTDDSGEIYILGLPFITQEKKVSPYIFGFVNSLAWLSENNKLGYIKLYVSQAADKNEVKRFNLALRCATNWVSGSKNFGIFQEDSTKVNWKHDTKDIPSFEVQKKVDGEMVTIDNRKKQQEFFLNEIEIINKAISNAKYDIGENTSASMNNSITATPIFEDEDDDNDADFEMTPSSTKDTSPVSISSDDEDDDLPF